MRRVRFYEYGGPEVLRVEEAEPPEPAAGELLVKAEAIGVTLPSVRRVRGGAELPGVLGGEVAGTVVGLGPGVAGFRVGERVVGIGFRGSYAELVPVATATAEHIPEGAGAVQAVALVRSGHVALGVLDAAGPLDGASVLVTGAASGVGHLAVQLARIRGARRVVAAAGSAAKAALSAAKAEFLRGLGADEVVGYAAEEWGEPVEVVLDGVGGEVLPRAVAALAPGGRLVFFGSGGGTVTAHDLLAGSRTVAGFAMARFATAWPDRYRRHGEELWELFTEGRLRPAVHAEIPLAEAARAHRVIEARANLGKVVLVP